LLSLLLLIVSPFAICPANASCDVSAPSSFFLPKLKRFETKSLAFWNAWYSLYNPYITDQDL
jgi:hypothetical protein